MAWRDEPEPNFHGLRARPNFEQLLDSANAGPFNIKNPGRKFTKQAFSFYNQKVFEQRQLGYGNTLNEDGEDQPPRLPDRPDRAQRRAAVAVIRQALGANRALAAAFDVANLEHQLSDETVPESVIQLAPSRSAEDCVFDRMANRSKMHWENETQRAIRHRVEEEGRRQYSDMRSSSLFDAYTQGSASSILQGEVPLEERFHLDALPLPAVGYKTELLVPDVAPPNLPQANGYAAKREFATFRELNLGQVAPRRTFLGTDLEPGDSYESHRRAA